MSLRFGPWHGDKFTKERLSNVQKGHSPNISNNETASVKNHNWAAIYVSGLGTDCF